MIRKQNLPDLQFVLPFRFRRRSPSHSLSPGEMYPARCSCPATDFPRCLPNLKPRCNREPHHWCSSENSFIQVQQQAKSWRAAGRLLPVLFFIQLGSDHVHSHGEHTPDCDVWQNLARSLHQTRGSLRWGQRHQIRVWFLRVFTHQDRV